MSVYVKGMEMPTNCAQCACCDDDARFCHAAHKYIPMIGKPKFCPLVEVKEPQGGMSDLISKQAAIDAIEMVDWYHQNQSKDMVSGANSDEHQAWYKAQDVYEAIEAVGCVEPKTGERIDRSDGGRIIYPWWETCECSQCGEYGSGAYNFCPNCGADMRGESDD